MGKFGKAGRFFGETVGELKRTSWPTVGEFKRATAVVFAGALFLGMFVSAIDFSLFQVTNLLVDIVR